MHLDAKIKTGPCGFLVPGNSDLYFQLENPVVVHFIDATTGESVRSKLLTDSNRRISVKADIQVEVEAMEDAHWSYTMVLHDYADPARS